MRTLAGLGVWGKWAGGFLFFVLWWWDSGMGWGGSMVFFIRFGNKQNGLIATEYVLDNFLCNKNDIHDGL